MRREIVQTIDVDEMEKRIRVKLEAEVEPIEEIAFRIFRLADVLIEGYEELGYVSVFHKARAILSTAEWAK